MTPIVTQKQVRNEVQWDHSDQKEQEVPHQLGVCSTEIKVKALVSQKKTTSSQNCEQIFEQNQEQQDPMAGSGQEAKASLSCEDVTNQDTVEEGVNNLWRWFVTMNFQDQETVHGVYLCHWYCKQLVFVFIQNVLYGVCLLVLTYMSVRRNVHCVEPLNYMF